ncbi:hypothetical protein [Streptomyces cellulosae]|uniref:PASTA domain-containing protein n=1 Tax=Streptomyces cellulosae TaxID=1968 RepID=A0ABW7YCZ3_STRCE
MPQFGSLAWRLALLGLGVAFVITPMTATAVSSESCCAGLSTRPWRPQARLPLPKGLATPTSPRPTLGRKPGRRPPPLGERRPSTEVTPDVPARLTAFGFDRVIAPETTGSVLSADGTSSARHTTDIAVSARPSSEARGRSTASGVLGGGPSPQAVFHTGGLRRTADSRRIPQRVIQVR